MLGARSVIERTQWRGFDRGLKIPRHGTLPKLGSGNRIQPDRILSPRLTLEGTTSAPKTQPVENVLKFLTGNSAIDAHITQLLLTSRAEDRTESARGILGAIRWLDGQGKKHEVENVIRILCDRHVPREAKIAMFKLVEFWPKNVYLPARLLDVEDKVLRASAACWAGNYERSEDRDKALRIAAVAANDPEIPHRYRRNIFCAFPDHLKCDAFGEDALAFAKEELEKGLFDPDLETRASASVAFLARLTEVTTKAIPALVRIILYDRYFEWSEYEDILTTLEAGRDETIRCIVVELSRADRRRFVKIFGLIEKLLQDNKIAQSVLDRALGLNVIGIRQKIGLAGLHVLRSLAASYDLPITFELTRGDLYGEQSSDVHAIRIAEIAEIIRLRISAALQVDLPFVTATVEDANGAYGTIDQISEERSIYNSLLIEVGASREEVEDSIGTLNFLVLHELAHPISVIRRVTSPRLEGRVDSLDPTEVTHYGEEMVIDKIALVLARQFYVYPDESGLFNPDMREAIAINAYLSLARLIFRNWNAGIHDYSLPSVARQVAVLEELQESETIGTRTQRQLADLAQQFRSSASMSLEERADFDRLIPEYRTVFRETTIAL